MLIFNERSLKDKLAGMAEARRSLFAAIVATRLSAGYESYAGTDDRKFQEALDFLWMNLDTKVSAEDVSHYVEEVIALIPEESKAQRSLAAQADDAAAALAYALRSLIDRNPQEAAWAARRAYESADNLVIQRADVEIAASSALDAATLERLRAECRGWGLNFFGRLS